MPQTQRNHQAGPLDPAASLEVPSDGFDHKQYMKARCVISNKQMCESGDQVMVQGPSIFGPTVVAIPHVWTAGEIAEFSRNGNLPIDFTAHNNTDTSLIPVKFAQVRGRSPDYPGCMDDLGRPVSFLGIGKPGFRCIYIFEAVEELIGGRESKWIAMIPSDFLDTPHRRMVNEDFMSTGIAKVNPLILNSQWHEFAANLNDLRH